MTEETQKRGLAIKGIKRAPDLVQYMTALGARGMRRAQIRVVADIYNETALSPPVSDAVFKAALNEAWGC